MIDLVRILRETFVAQAEHHPTLDSTNSQAARCAARRPRELPLLVVADEQTGGRGRGGKRWWTGSGSLAFSLLVDPQTVGADRSRSPLVALASAVAVAETLRPLLPGRPLGIHWPNDVAVDGKKLCGILVDVLADRRHVIGIGVNTNSTMAEAPAELQATTATVRDLSGREHDQTDMLVALLRQLDQQFATLRRDSAAVAAAADRLCTQRGQRLTLRWENRTASGICRGIAPDGAILLETPAGVERFYSGTTGPQNP
ncbi:MAG: biotin--[acetyl-CoA-carboxylase] ligase [Thermoguttaceae bacterium]